MFKTIHNCITKESTTGRLQMCSKVNIVCRVIYKRCHLMFCVLPFTAS